MHFVWRDYDPETMNFIENWLDEDAVKSTGLDEGFRNFYAYWEKKEGFVVGDTFWCKVACENQIPIAVISICRDEQKVVIMEFLVAPEIRGQGQGTKLLRELLKSESILGFSINRAEAVIFPDNKASRHAFENAGFYCHHIYDDGSAMLYVYEK